MWIAPFDEGAEPTAIGGFVNTATAHRRCAGGGRAGQIARREGVCASAAVVLITMRRSPDAEALQARAHDHGDAWCHDKPVLIRRMVCSRPTIAQHHLPAVMDMDALA